MKKTIVLLCAQMLWLSGIAAELQANLNVALIPDSLKKDAYGVVRYDNTVFEYNSPTSGIEKETIAITILDKKGESLSNFYYPGDRFKTLKSFSGKLYDATGKLLRKFKMSDVQTSEWSQYLASDDKRYGLSCDPPFFPVTIVYEYEIDWKDGILSFPYFFPQNNYNLSVEKAKYLLILPSDVTFKSKAINIQATPAKSTINGTTTYEWNAGNLKAIEQEPNDPDFISFVPILYLSPLKFIYDKVPGSINDWNFMGKWEYDLIQNRDILPEETKSKLIEMTRNAKTDREKVKILYDYLGENTHYVGIQLGIGGYQPIQASEVCKTKFGDCKGLSNYLKSMLSAIGISSNYCTIKYDEDDKRLFSDYANFYQMNHAILQVPLSGDTLWLECTNPKVPFGFAHNGISGHDVLVCTANGGIMQHVPDYPDSLNIEQNNAITEIAPDGSARVSIQKQCHVKIYDKYDYFPYKKATEQADDLREDINLPNVTMGTIQFKEDKSPLPSIYMDYTWSTPQYGNKTGNRLFIPVNPLRSTYEGLKTSRRKHDIKISMGFKDIDSICIRIPNGYQIEAMPSPIDLSTPFGKIKTSLFSTGKEIIVRQSVFVVSGEYKLSSYPQFIDFFDKINTAYKGKIILRMISL